MPFNPLLTGFLTGFNVFQDCIIYFCEIRAVFTPSLLKNC